MSPIHWRSAQHDGPQLNPFVDGLARRAVHIVLITGGTGFTGSHLVHRLVSEGRTVRVLARATSSTDRLPRCVEIVTDDLQDRTTLARAVLGVHTVFHVAAAFRQTHLSYDEYVAVNVTATGALVFAAATAGVRRFVHVSTVGVHGDVTGVANEDAPFRPGDWYQETKARGEVIARDVARHKHPPLTVIRPSGIYGPGDT
jgi:nucleoside-diphosphate-sugar epimerase